MVFCNHLGQIDQKSNFETRLYDELCKNITDDIKDPTKLCFIWLFLRSWGPSAHSKISKLFYEPDLKCAVFEIMSGVKNGSVGDFPVVQKLREKLARSPTEIFPFFEACLRKVH
jgi:hypothetical protein